MKFYHGTAYENAMKIKEKGSFLGEVKTIWDVSDEDMLYMRKGEDFSSNYDSDDEDEYEVLIETVESAQIAAALTNSKESCICYFEFDIPEDIVEEYVDEDDSCENMHGCYQISRKVLDQGIRSGKINTKLYKVCNTYNPNLRIFYLAGLYNRKNASAFLQIEDELLEQALDAISGTEYFIDCMYEFCVEEKEEIEIKFKALLSSETLGLDWMITAA